jgi:hypothetical protein
LTYRAIAPRDDVCFDGYRWRIELRRAYVAESVSMGIDIE